MDATLAKYSFLPWVRQGLGNSIIEADTFGGNLPANAAIERPDVVVTVTVKASKSDEHFEQDIPKTVKIQGPCDVLGINQRTIIRVHPKKGVTNFETNNLCYVEFYEEDLPWRFTPAKPVGNKLRPWLSLIVLRNDEFERSSSGGTPTPFISLNQPSLTHVFCNEKDTYALAHVHVLEDLGQGNEASDLQNKLAQNPDKALSRVICPRKLEYHAHDNEYHAFLIPTFETGRLAGMGLSTETTKAQEPSWSRAKINNGTNPVAYPYYFSWSFKVSDGGDFETLAEKLTARELPENVGKREMDLKNMGFGINPTEPNTLGFVEGAMRHEDFSTAPWPVSDNNLQVQFRNVLNISSDLQEDFPEHTQNEFFYSPALDLDPIISPPTYGKWHRGTNKLSAGVNDWLHELNMHPSHRAAAGLGTRVVQQHQEEFMEMAWEQIGEINEANQKIIENELSKRIANSLLKNKIGKMSQVDVMAAAGQAFNVMKFGQGTLKKTLVESQVPTALRSGAFIKVANNFTPTALMTIDNSDGAKEILSNTFFNRINASEEDNQKISAAPISKVPLSFAISPQVAQAAIDYVVLNPAKTFMQNLAIAIKTEGKGFKKNDVLANLPAHFTPEERSRASAILDGVKTSTNSTSPDLVLIVEVYEDVFKSKISAAFDEGIYEKVKFVKNVSIALPLLFSHAEVLQNRIAFKESFQTLFASPEAKFAKVFTRAKRLQLPTDINKTVFEKLNPFFNYKRKLGAWLAEEQANQNKPIMAYPRFPIPTYNYLKEISADYIIPNISEIEPDTITLMQPNKKFIESFLTGMNHEFSRELLWREFPTDMRGSYFRHFWEYNNDPTVDLNQKSGETTEAYVDRILSFQNNAADIKEIHKWKSGKLGENHQGGPSLVLLIKGDLLRKYPGTIVYAQKAEFAEDETAPRVLGNYIPDDDSQVKWPIITGNLEPDVYFFGFDLEKSVANGNRTNNPGWFFVLRERPGQISFGLDDLGNDSLDATPNTWNDITWEHISNNPNQQPDYLKITERNIQVENAGSAPNNEAHWGAASSDMAYILYQSPVLFARHASTMLNE